MTTTLYLHAATSTNTGTFPQTRHGGTAPALQGGLTPWDDGQAGADAASLHRSMNTTIGSSETNIQVTTIATNSSQTYYFCKWLSPPLNQTSIAANTWTLNYAFAEDNSNANYNGVLPYIYIWRPSGGGSFVNWIVDQVNPSDLLEPTSINTERLKNTTVTGSSATCAVGDVIVFEYWARITQTSTVASHHITVYFDGGTTYPSGTTNDLVSDVAAYLQTPETISFSSSGPTACTVTGKTVTNKIINKH